ncbi:Serine/threonine protein kinase [Austwickia chelonae]|uniref:Putative serine/threonine protein kinase n=1 Tax=Austwickia chelonae NBRC 105200 TaxID=1184607 RepID=K6VR53_9MICO|nr:serine/threonine-protein kinase [Austwickia chelonae]GAB77845.1 putative serine/threonine protein kinase [Austwickia chelonae NBRC 105200]SEV90700.1 Serine/threonine protein kinase [Austwickia chelonae]
MSATVGRGPSPGAGRLGRYRLCSELGRGGMGVVHLALDEEGQAVAIKVLRDHVLDDPAARARLSREADHLSRIRHPGIAGIIDADVEGARPYVVTRYVPGPSLEQYVAQHGPLSAPKLLGLAKDLSAALSAVHTADVVHRDLKPGNVLIHDGRGVLIDFGIAHGSGDVRLTSTGLVMGTPGFLAPEILDGADVTPATDWWAWAATLAFAASGRVPFGDQPVDAVLARIRAGECDLTGVDPELAPLLRAALDPRPGARPTREQILYELERYASGGRKTAAIPAMPVTRALPGAAQTAAAPVAAPGATAAAPVAPQVPAPTAEASAPAPAWKQAVDRAQPLWEETLGRAKRHRSSGLVICLAALFAALTLAAPVKSLLLAISWTWLARSVERAGRILGRQRSEHGVRRWDTTKALLLMPLHAVTTLVSTLVGALAPTVAAYCAVLGCITLQKTGVLPGSSFNPGAPGPLFVGSVTAMVVFWWGTGSEHVRLGTRAVLESVGAWRYGSACAAALLLGLAAVIALISQSTGFTPSWEPLSGDPFGWLRKALR